MVEFKKELVFSRSYTTSVNIAAGVLSSENIITQEDINQHAPFDTIVILNSDSVALGFLFDRNPNNMIPIPANNGSVATENQKFSDFTLKNLDAAAEHTAGKIYILIQKFKYVRID